MQRGKSHLFLNNFFKFQFQHALDFGRYIIKCIIIIKTKCKFYLQLVMVSMGSFLSVLVFMIQGAFCVMPGVYVML